MPQTELLKEHSLEILYFTDRADEFLADMLRSYQDKPFRSVADDDLDIPGEEKKPARKPAAKKAAKKDAE